jgi:hypothetical protein
MILSAMQYYDNKNTGFINFTNFRKATHNLKLNLSEKYTEFLIYFMKKNETNSKNMSLEDLAYGNIIKLLSSDSTDSDDSDSDSDKSKCKFPLKFSRK